MAFRQLLSPPLFNDLDVVDRQNSDSNYRVSLDSSVCKASNEIDRQIFVVSISQGRYSQYIYD